ncbi:MAG: 50S ribosomal protein L18 [Alphaproteobacteria bacterium MarineAlpha3_Bin5]|nr:50S ribosomal protein L18 [Magnetovibrio sp.]PPR75487.1 MAG: 50S ribosomal protein L18 [Alphaproteobacteria bacterium MarineAlpha3_Bin5]|tara:strand:+ start:454 stop:816 length:363 start_codon:yes stop_codon:yes gene_type:complete
MPNSKQLFNRRAFRTRGKLKKASPDRPRLSVFRSGRHIYAQLIDDKIGATLVAASTLEKEMRSKLKSSSNKAAATEVGSLLAKRALEQDLKDIVFDRGGYKYHGRVKALADAARAGGLKF